MDWPLLGFADGAEINAKLLALLVKMAALEAQCFRGIGHVVFLALELAEDGGALEGFGAFGERP